jgi:hypothetical protein
MYSAHAADPVDASCGSTPAMPAISQYAWLTSKRESIPNAMIDAAARAMPTPVLITSTPSSLDLEWGLRGRRCIKSLQQQECCDHRTAISL